MTHSDDDGLILPPKLAPIQVVIVPIPKPGPEIQEVAEKLMLELKLKNIRCNFDKDDKNRPGFKFAEHELKGVPIRIGIGARDLENGVVEIVRRDTKEKESVLLANAVNHIVNLLEEIQINLFERAKSFRDLNTHIVNSWDEFIKIIEEKPGFVYAHWDGTNETEDKIKELTKATIRCIPLDSITENGTCIYSGKPSNRRVLLQRLIDTINQKLFWS